jgi:hypothetical protein
MPRTCHRSTLVEDSHPGNGPRDSGISDEPKVTMRGVTERDASASRRRATTRLSPERSRWQRVDTNVYATRSSGPARCRTSRAAAEQVSWVTADRDAALTTYSRRVPIRATGRCPVTWVVAAADRPGGQWLRSAWLLLRA